MHPSETAYYTLVPTKTWNLDCQQPTMYRHQRHFSVLTVWICVIFCISPVANYTSLFLAILENFRAFFGRCEFAKISGVANYVGVDEIAYSLQVPIADLRHWFKNSYRLLSIHTPSPPLARLLCGLHRVSAFVFVGDAFSDRNGCVFRVPFSILRGKRQTWVKNMEPQEVPRTLFFHQLGTV